MEDKTPFISKQDMRKQQYGDISGKLLDKGFPGTMAFSMAHAVLFLRKFSQKQTRVNHYQEIKKQLTDKLNTGLFGITDLKEIKNSDNLPEEINYNHIRGEIDDLLSNGYSYLAKTKNNYFMVRTNNNGHKVSQIKQIF